MSLTVALADELERKQPQAEGARAEKSTTHRVSSLDGRACIKENGAALVTPRHEEEGSDRCRCLLSALRRIALSVYCHRLLSPTLWDTGDCRLCRLAGGRSTRCRRHHRARPPIPYAEVSGNGTPKGPWSLPEHSEATDRIPNCTTHDDIRQEMNIEREP